MKNRHALWLFVCVEVVIILGSGSGDLRAEWQQIELAARKEGQVVVSLPPSADLRIQLEKAFEGRFAKIDLVPVPARGAINVRKIATESTAGVHYFDVHIGGTYSMLIGLVKPRLVSAVEPYMILPEVKEPKNWWGGHIYADKTKRFAYSFAAYLSQNLYYNSKLMRPDQIRSYEDLLDPKWKGKMGFLDPRVPGPGDATWSYIWNVKGEDYLKKLVDQDLTIVRNPRVLADSLAKGKLAMTIGVPYYFMAPFLQADFPVKAFPIPKEGTYVTAGTGNLTILKDPPHPNATKVFVNWLLGKEGQETFSKAMNQASRRFDVSSSLIGSYGTVLAKEALSVKDYYQHEIGSEEKIKKVRIPALDFARKLLK